MVLSNVKISPKPKNKSYLSIEKGIMKCKKGNICYKHQKRAWSSNRCKKQFSRESITNLFSLVTDSLKRTRDIGFFEKI